MHTFGLAIQLCLLWFLIILFTGSIDAEQSYRETYIVVFGTAIAGLLGRFLPVPSLIVELPALYYLVSWACGTDKKTTWKICGWYCASYVLLAILFYLLVTPRA